jgi:hypothetical protein
MGDISRCRSLFKQAVSRQLDWPEAVFQAWIAFERECGDLTSTYAALERIEVRSRQLALRTYSAAQEQPQHALRAPRSSAVRDVGMDGKGDDAKQAGKKRKKGATESAPRKKAKQGSDDIVVEAKAAQG